MDVNLTISAVHLHILPDPEVLARLDVLKQTLDLAMETIMTDVTKLTAIATRLQASDTAALAALQGLKDQNTALAAQLAAIPAQDPATQTAIDAVVTALTTTADSVDKAVTANPATPNLTPSPSA
jgi:hypothetical protein